VLSLQHSPRNLFLRKPTDYLYRVRRESGLWQVCCTLFCCLAAEPWQCVLMEVKVAALLEQSLACRWTQLSSITIAEQSEVRLKLPWICVNCLRVLPCGALRFYTHTRLLRTGTLLFYRQTTTNFGSYLSAISLSGWFVWDGCGSSDDPLLPRWDIVHRSILGREFCNFCCSRACGLLLLPLVDHNKILGHTEK